MSDRQLCPGTTGCLPTDCDSEETNNEYPEPTPPRVTAGVDWAKDDHVLCVVDEQEGVVERLTVAHNAAGLTRAGQRLLRAGVAEVGIERGDGPLVEALLRAGLRLYVIPPGQVKNRRSRYGSAGNKDDRFDAYVLADVVRTDARRLRPMVFDTEQTTTLPASVRARRDLVAARVAVGNQLRGRVRRYQERMRSYVEANQEIGRMHVHMLTGPDPHAEPSPEPDMEAITALIERAVNAPSCLTTEA